MHERISEIFFSGNFKDLKDFFLCPDINQLQQKKITRHTPCIFFLFVRTLLGYALVLEFIRFWRQNDFHMRSWCLLLTTNDPTELMAKCLIT
jgi:hypothetical protein